MFYTRFFTTCLFLLVHCFCFSQNNEQYTDFVNKVADNYKTQYQMEVFVYTFPEEGDLRTQIDSCYTAKLGNNIYISIKDVEIIQNDKYLITINNLNRNMRIKKINQNILLNNFSEPNIENILNQLENYSINNNGGQLVFKQKLIENYKSIEYYFGKKSEKLEKVIYYFNRDVEKNAPYKIEIDYKNIDGQVNHDFFSEKNYFFSSDEKLTPIGKYKDFEINQEL